MFATLTVEENLSLSFRRSRGRQGLLAALDEAYAMFPQLGRRADQIAGTMSGGEQRMLSLSRVLVESPALLIADECRWGWLRSSSTRPMPSSRRSNSRERRC